MAAWHHVAADHCRHLTDKQQDMGRTKIADAGNDLIDDLDQQLNNSEQFDPMVGDIDELYLRPLEEVKDSVFLRIRTQVLKHVKTRHI